MNKINLIVLGACFFTYSLIKPSDRQEQGAGVAMSTPITIESLAILLQTSLKPVESRFDIICDKLDKLEQRIDNLETDHARTRFGLEEALAYNVSTMKLSKTHDEIEKEQRDLKQTFVAVAISWTLTEEVFSKAVAKKKLSAKSDQKIDAIRS